MLMISNDDDADGNMKAEADIMMEGFFQMKLDSSDGQIVVAV